ncbi:unnamed protein product [Owenia fusiformis]|uniref:Uncharacterized protein n=1 Tax=Owenia fusiformis TaxID=6347 RepID=A0A8J1XJ71_OWEFU|nr:unnamed protein product [Owenia fusiformis]
MVRPRTDAFQESYNMQKESSASKSKRKRVHVPHSERPTEFVAQRNERERSRVHSVNEAFMALRKHVPLKVKDPSKRVSKAKILQAAIDHIYNLLDSLVNTETQENCSTAQNCLQNNQPKKKSNSPTKKRHTRKQTLSRKIKDISKDDFIFECNSDTKENQHRGNTDELLYTDNSQYQPQMVLSHYEQYSPKVFDQYIPDFQMQQQQQQQQQQQPYSNSQVGTYEQYHSPPHNETEERYNSMEFAFQGFKEQQHSESWTTMETTASQQTVTEYYPNTIQTFLQENTTPYQMTESWMHGLPPSPNDSGFADDKSTSSVSEISFPMTEGDILEDISRVLKSPEEFVI